MLANSVWPRGGYDTGNRSRVPAPGPTVGEIEYIVRLPETPQPRPERLSQFGGIAVASDGTIRVARAGMLMAIAPGGDLLWLHLLREGADVAERHSAPVALDNGQTLVTLARISTTVDARGHLRRQIAWDGSFDDSGLAPNFTPEGDLIGTSLFGGVAIARGNEWEDVGIDLSFGYDILPPAVYDDGSLAIAGYYGAGFCRVRPDGAFVWRSTFKEADLLPTVNRAQFAAVGSLNDKLSLIFDPAGQQVGEYGEAAVFAEYNDGDWIARSESVIARIDSAGDARWELPILDADRWSRVQPIVDSDGRIYVADAEGVHCLSPDGDTLFTVPTDSGPISLALIGDSRAACLVDRDLLVLI